MSVSLPARRAKAAGRLGPELSKKIQEDAWKRYKRAYKKYYARVMKGNMNREDFNAWVEFAAGRRDTTLLLLEGIRDFDQRARLIERLREGLNRA